VETETEKRMAESESLQTREVRLNDHVIRLIGIPGFGIAIPNVTGLLDEIPLQRPEYWLSYAYFIAMSGLI
jgi:hypothetical protein